MLSCITSNSSLGACCVFLSVSSSKPFKLWTSRNFGTILYLLQSKIVLQIFFLPVCLSTTAYVRSPTSPRSVTYEELRSSPIIDFTGYRHKDTTVPIAPEDCCWFTNSHHHPS